MPLLCNMSDVSLPSTAQLTAVEKQRMGRLQVRSTLDFYDEKRHMDPLSEEEREELDALELRQNDQRMPR